MGHFRDDLTADRTLRFWSVGGVLIAYRWAARPIKLVLIERGEMDWRVWLQVLDDDPDLTPR